MTRIVLQELESDRSLTVGDLDALVGRDPACGFVIEGPKSRVVSGRHARIFFQDGAWWIQDMSRNGTILDDERLQSGQRHALRTGQVIGLGESGPRFRVTALDSRNVAETMIESTASGAPGQTTAPRARPQIAGMSPPMGNPADGTKAARPPAPDPNAVSIEEPTEPAKLSGDWHISLALRATHSDQRFEAKGSVVKVGRSPECLVRIPPEQGASVSRIHAEITIGESGVVIRDAGSRNGTFVNGNRIQGAQSLVTGDRIMLGSGGPTLEVEDLHILRGEGPRTAPAKGVGGGPTPDAVTAKQASAQPFREPPTGPAPFGDHAAVAATRVSPPRMASPARGQARATPGRSPAQGTGGRKRAIVLAVIGALLLAAAVIIGRMTAS